MRASRTSPGSRRTERRLRGGCKARHAAGDVSGSVRDRRLPGTLVEVPPHESDATSEPARESPPIRRAARALAGRSRAAPCRSSDTDVDAQDRSAPGVPPKGHLRLRAADRQRGPLAADRSALRRACRRASRRSPVMHGWASIYPLPDPAVACRAPLDDLLLGQRLDELTPQARRVVGLAKLVVVRHAAELVV